MTDSVDTRSSNGSPQAGNTHTQEPPSRYSTWGLGVGVVGLVAAWAMSFGWPILARHAVNAGQVYGVGAIGWGVVVALNLVAAILGVLGSRRPTGKLAAGAAIALGVSGTATFVVNLLLSILVRPYIG
jgi:hypothetical protein